MAGNLRRDAGNGMFANEFDLTLEGEGEEQELRFQFSDQPRKLPEIDGGELAHELADLVECLNLKELVAPVLACQGPMPLQNRGRGQYRLTKGTRPLLSLAKKVGPLFGAHAAQEGMVDGNVVRERVDWWIAAAGVLAFARKLMSVLGGEESAEVLNNEVVFTFVGYDSVHLLRIEYLLDAGFPGAYGRMVAISEQEYESTFPTEEKDNGRGEAPTLTQGGYSETGTIWFKGAQAKTGMPFVSNAWRTIKDIVMPKKKRERSAQEDTIKLIGPDGSPVGTIGPTARVYGLAMKGAVSGLAGPGAPRPYKDFALPEGEHLSATYTNMAAMGLGRSRREALYAALFDALAMLHTHRVVTDRRFAHERLPRYSTALEHLWCSLVDSRLKWPTRYCLYCGRPFVGRGGRKWCSEGCGHDGRKALETLRSITVRQIATTIAEGHEDLSFRASEVLDELGGSWTAAEVSDIMARISNGQPGYFKSLGGNGRGRRYRLIPRDASHDATSLLGYGEHRSGTG